MDLRLPSNLVANAIAATDCAVLKKARDETQLRRIVIVNGLALPKATLKYLYNATSETTVDYAGTIKFLYSAMKSKRDLKIRNMGELKLALVSFLKKDFIKGYLFKQGEKSAVLPYLVIEVTDSIEAAQHYSRDYVRARTVSMRFVSSESLGEPEEHSETFYPSQLIALARGMDLEVTEVMSKKTKEHESMVIDFKCEAGILVEDILNREGLFRETAELHELYDAQIERFMKYLPMYGQQFRVRGESITNSWYFSGESMLTEGKPGRCIMDTIPPFCLTEDTEEGSKPKRRNRNSYNIYGRSHRNDDDDEENSFNGIENLVVPLSEVTPSDFQKVYDIAYNETKGEAPLHPTLKIFHLEKQNYFRVHVRNLAPYKYKDDIGQYLVLPDEVKDLTEMLVGMTMDGVDDEDVIEGKSQSTIIAALGDPGVGKTLMAEVMSEACKKPLYKIPADQLGGNAEELEVQLKRVLRRAERWNCVLMIDEANAYVHARGTDIAQNAIVGVFLRRLEYYKGILILTTNQTSDLDDFDIDDAILSRCSAVIRLGMPDKEQSAKIWRIQAKLLKVPELTDAMIEKLVEQYSISGRSIRQLLKLTARTARFKEEALTMKHFKSCAAFIPFTASEAKAVQAKTQK